MLFDKLTFETRQKVFMSMTPLDVLPKTVVIQQGDEEAHKFYVLESGFCDVLQTQPDGWQGLVHSYKPGRRAPPPPPPRPPRSHNGDPLSLSRYLRKTAFFGLPGFRPGTSVEPLSPCGS